MDLSFCKVDIIPAVLKQMTLWGFGGILCVCWGMMTLDRSVICTIQFPANVPLFSISGNVC